MIVNESPRRAEHIITGSGPLVYQFPVLNANDLMVIQDGIVLNPVQYQVTGVGQDGGGTVILATNPAIGTRVVIIGDQPYKQTSVYTVEAFPPQRIQDDFNKVVIMIQQILEILNRTPKFAPDSTVDTGVLRQPTAVDTFLRCAQLDPLIIDWAAIATLAGAVGIPLATADGGTGGSYATAAAVLQGLGAARWGSMPLSPDDTGMLSVSNPLTGNAVLVGPGPITSISTSGIVVGTILILDYTSGGNLLTDTSTFQLQGRSNYTTVIGDRSVFYHSGLAWIEILRSPLLALSNATKFMRGDGTWQTIATLVPTGVSRGLTISNNLTDPTNDIDIAPGDAFSDEANPALRVQMWNPGIFVKQLDFEWAPGSGNGGRVAGQALADGTWHIFMFRRASGAIDFCFTNNLTFVTPDGGTNRVNIMSVLRESSSIQGFINEGDWLGWSSQSIQYDTVNPGAAAIPIPIRSPLGIRCMVRFVAQLRTSSAAVVARFTSMDAADQPTALDVAPLYQVGLVNANHLTTARQVDTLTNLTAQVRGRLNVSDAGTRLRIVTEGYFHPRGKH